jgi:hypothetical protein
MGLREILTGRRKLAGPAPDRLFAMTTAYVAMQTSGAVTSRGKAAIVFQSLDTADFRGIVDEMEQVVRATAAESGASVERSQDDYGFSWMVVADDDFDDLVVAINAVSTALQEGGYGERVLCAVFAFTDTTSQPPRPIYWIYNYKRGAFSPFVPESASDRARDNERELVLKAQMANELPIEPELSRWFALWGIPI